MPRARTDPIQSAYARLAACARVFPHMEAQRRRARIKMEFATLLSAQECLADNDEYTSLVTRKVKVITDLIQGEGGTATTTITTIMQSKESLFDYLEKIRMEVVASTSDNNNIANKEEVDEKGIGRDIVDLILNAAVEMEMFRRPQPPRDLFGGTTNATATTMVPTFALGVAPTIRTTSSLALTSMNSSSSTKCGPSFDPPYRFKPPTSTFVFAPPLLLSETPIPSSRKEVTETTGNLDTVIAPTTNTGHPPMLYVAPTKPFTTKTVTSGASLPPISMTTAPSPFNAFSKKQEAKPTVKNLSTVVPPSVINRDSSPAPVTLMSMSGKYACFVCDKVFTKWGDCKNHIDTFHPGVKFVQRQAEARNLKLGTPNYYCNVCNITCQDVTSFHQHKKGKKHMQQAAITVPKTSQKSGGKGDTAHYITSSDDSMTVSSCGKIDNCDNVVDKLMSYTGGEFKAPVVHQDSSGLLNILPPEWSDALVAIGMDHVSDISLDLGRRPYCWHNHQRKYLCDSTDHVVNEHDFDKITMWLQDFGDDNRAGIDGQLHRISAIRNNVNKIIGLTIRVGRYIEGNSDMIRDLLKEDSKSILILGEPGSGKTTIVRDMAKVLSLKDNVFIIDTSNEIAGDGNIPHLCVGDSRRMMVKSLSSQADTMIQCVQNHTPTVMIIDEIGRKREVEAAQTSKNRGVRMVASAHGDLRSLLKNKDIRGLIGGLETVSVGDAMAKEIQQKNRSSTIQKQLTTRSAAPIFEVIIEVKRDRLNEWHVITDAAKAVDDILQGEKYEIQKRMRCIKTGRIFVERVHS